MNTLQDNWDKEGRSCGAVSLATTTHSWRDGGLTLLTIGDVAGQRRNVRSVKIYASGYWNRMQMLENALIVAFIKFPAVSPVGCLYNVMPK